MIHQFKPILLVSGLLFFAYLCHAQDTVITASDHYIDSVQNALKSGFERQIRVLENELTDEITQNQRLSDSLLNSQADQERRIRDLEQGNARIASSLNRAEQLITDQSALFKRENAQTRRFLRITASILFFLLLLSATLFILLVQRIRKETDFKISALKKYTYSEIEETRVTLMKKFRKRLKKMGAGMRGKNGSKKSSKKKKGKKK